MKSIVIIFMFLILSVFANGQTFSKSMSKTDLETKIKTFKNNKQFEIKYDKFKDKTTVLARHFVIVYGKNIFNVQSLHCSAGFDFSGEMLKEDVKAFTLEIEISSQHQAMFSEEPGLIFLIDGERAKQENGNYKVEVRSLSQLSNLTTTDETIVYSIEPKVFKKMATAKQIEFQLGNKEFKFKPETLEMFKNLYKLAS